MIDRHAISGQRLTQLLNGWMDRSARRLRWQGRKSPAAHRCPTAACQALAGLELRSSYEAHAPPRQRLRPLVCLGGCVVGATLPMWRVAGRVRELQLQTRPVRHTCEGCVLVGMYVAAVAAAPCAIVEAYIAVC